MTPMDDDIKNLENDDEQQEAGLRDGASDDLAPEENDFAPEEDDVTADDGADD